MPQFNYLLLKTCLLSVPCYLLMMKLCFKGPIGVTRQVRGKRAMLAEGAAHQDAGVNLHNTSGITDNLALLEVGCKLKSNGK